MGLFDNVPLETETVDRPKARPERPGGLFDSVPIDDTRGVTETAAPVARPERSASPARAAIAPAMSPEPEMAQGLVSDRIARVASGAMDPIASVPAAKAVFDARFDQHVKDTAPTQVQEAKRQADSFQAILDAGVSPMTGQPMSDSERETYQQRLDEAQLAVANWSMMAEGGVIPASQRQGFKDAAEMRAWMQRTAGSPNPDFNGFWGDFFTGAGNMAGMMATGVATGGLGAAMTGSTMNAESQYNEAIAAGADEATAMQAALIGSGIGTLEAVPLMRAIKPLTSRLPKGKVSRAVTKIITGAAEEAGQEGVAQVLNNLTAQGLYDPDRGWNDGVTEAMILGAALGGTFSTIGAGRGLLQKDETSAQTSAPVAPKADNLVTIGDEASPLPTETIAKGKQKIAEILGEAPEADTVPDVDTTPAPAPVSAEIAPDPEILPAESEVEVTAPDVPVQEDITPEAQDAPEMADPQESGMIPEYDRNPETGEMEPTGRMVPDPDALKKAPPPEVVDAAAAEAAPEPTEAQKEAGNYKKGHIRMHGLDISIENAQGSDRTGTDPDGNEWSVKMPAHYGYVRRTEGADGDHVDVYIGPRPESEAVFVVDQVNPETGKFDEHKVMLGFETQNGAQTAYNLGFSDGKGPDRLGAMTPMTMTEFKAWLKDGDQMKPVGANLMPVLGSPQETENDFTETALQADEQSTKLANEEREISDAEIESENSKQTDDGQRDAETDTASNEVEKRKAPVEKSPGGAAGRPFPDFDGEEVKGYDDDTSEDGRNSPIKNKFHKAGKSFFTAVGKILKERGFVAAESRGKPIKPVRSSWGGAAGSGEVTFTMIGPDGVNGIYAQISDSAMTRTGVNMMYRINKASKPYSSGDNQFMKPTDWTPSKFADHVMELYARYGGKDAPVERTEAEPKAGSNKEGDYTLPKGWLFKSFSKTLGSAEDIRVKGGPIKAVFSRTSPYAVFDVYGSDKNEATAKAVQMARAVEAAESLKASGHLKNDDDTAPDTGNDVPEVSTGGTRPSDIKEQMLDHLDGSDLKSKVATGLAGSPVQHTTKRNKELDGIIIKDVSREDAKEIDKYTFRKNGGYFIRLDDAEAWLEDQDDTSAMRDEPESSIKTATSGSDSPDIPSDPNATKKEAEGRVAAKRQLREDGNASTERQIEDQKRAAQNAVEDPDSIPSKPRGKAYGARNRLVKKDEADALAEKLREMLKSTTRTGIDPEFVSIGTRLAIFHIEAGSRKFLDFAAAISDHLGKSPKDLTQYLRSWYNGARDMMDDSDIPVADMDPPEVVAEQLKAIRDGIQDFNGEPDAGEGPGEISGSGENQGDRKVSRPTGSEGKSDAGRDDEGSGPGTTSERTAKRPGSGSSADRGRGNGRSGRTADLNHVIEPGEMNLATGAITRARQSLDAIKTLKTIEDEGRLATADEKVVMARYGGGGTLAKAFARSDGTLTQGWDSIGAELEAITTAEERKVIAKSTQYAFYTSEDVVRGMWAAVQQLGFKGGLVYEPGMGTGRFIGMMPGNLARKTQYQGLEMDPITARIAKALYPKASIQEGDLTKTPLIENHFDVVIGNPPFGDISIGSDPDYPQKFLIHDYFFAKSLDAVRPGGLLMFVTSAGTMNKMDSKAREYLAARADLVGAVRLPSSAFKEEGTEVTTDIIILRKRAEGEAASDVSWIPTQEIDLPDRTGQMIKAGVNEYFVTNPDMILGEHGMFDKLISGPRYGVRGTPGQDLGADLRRAFEKLPTNIMTARAAEREMPRVDAETTERKPGSYYLKDGTLYQFDGRNAVEADVKAKDQEKIKKLVAIKDALRTTLNADLKGDQSAADAARASLNKVYDDFVKKFGPINQVERQYRRPNRIQMENLRSEAREEARLRGEEFDEGTFDPSEMIEEGAKVQQIAKVRAEKYAGKRGYQSGTFDPDSVPDLVIEKRPNIDPFMEDPESYRLRAIEKYDDQTDKAKKGLVFSESVVTRTDAPSINSTEDALIWSLNIKGRVDLDHIAELRDTDATTVKGDLEGLIFETPEQPGRWETREKYLSGNVRAKLETARSAAINDSRFERNVDELKRAMPATISHLEIMPALGANWIPVKDYVAFGRDLGINITAEYNATTANWTIKGDLTSSHSISTWGTKKMPFPKLLKKVMNGTPIKVTKEGIGPDGKPTRVPDETATEVLNEKAKEIRKKFEEWLFEDESRRVRLVEKYNVVFNSDVAPVYSGDYLTTPGINKEWKWRPHQRRVIARILQSGNTYLAHAPGAGKTSEMISAGMELRRLGMARKPMYVVPNHMLGQFATEFYQQYPMANIAVADERRFHKDRRKLFIADVGANDYDAVVITHSAFGFIPVSGAFNDKILQREIDAFEEAIRSAENLKEDHLTIQALKDANQKLKKRLTVKGVEKGKEKLEQKIKSKGSKSQDEVFTFEEMGIDTLFIDEAHEFRKLDFATRMGQIKGITPDGSKRAMDLFIKTRYLEEVNPGRGVHFASGTPVTNTMAELFTVSRYMQETALVERGIERFDAWANTFGETESALETLPDGNYKDVTRFSQFVNTSELSNMVRQVMDVVTSAELRQYVTLPELKGGKRQLNVAEPTPELRDYQEHLAQRMEAIAERKGKVQKGDDILLSVINDGRKAAIDMRLVDPDMASEGRTGKSNFVTDTKLERMIDNVARINAETTKQPFYKVGPNGYEDKPFEHGPATQMIFSTLGVNENKQTGFSVYKAIVEGLVARGVKRSEIAILHDAKTHIAKQRLFNDMNEGKKRILIASKNGFTGINAQRRMAAIHNLDPLWFPADDEQRNARGIRQGNMNREIGIYDYSTKGTYDSTMWQMMERKARFIQGFFEGDPSVRSMEDLGEASQYEQAKALTTKDPRILSLTEWKQERDKLDRMRRGLAAEKARFENDLRSAKADVKSFSERLAGLEKVAAKVPDLTGDKFRMTVLGTEYDDRKEAGQALINEAQARIADDRTGTKKVGQVGDFTLKMEVRKFLGEYSFDVIIDLDKVEYTTGETFDAVGLSRRIVGALGRVKTDQDRMKANIKKSEDDLSIYKSALNGLREFQHQVRMDELAKEIDDLEAELRAESDTKKTVKEQVAWKPTKAQQPFLDTLRAELDRMMLKKVRLSIDSELAAQGAFIADDLGNMQILIGASENPIATARHEAIHALRNMGLFRDGEWAALKRMADRRWMAEYDIAARYPDLSRSKMLEEAIAEAFAYHKPQDAGPIRNAFAKIKRFFRAMASTMRLVPRESIASIFEAVDTGEVGSRRRQRAFAAEKQQRAGSLKGARSGPHLPDRHITDALDEGQAFWDRVSAGKGGAHDAIDRARVKLQDKFLMVLRAQQAVEKATGKETPQHMNAYLAEETYSGRVGFKLDQIDHKYTKEIVDLIVGSETLTANTVAEYLYARHAPERNQRIADINPDMQDGGSGMTNDEARDILRSAHAGPDADRLRKIGRLIDQLREWGIKERLKHGLITQAEADAWRNAYKHYVPLKGWAETENADAEIDYTGMGRGYNTRGPESKRAMGRQSEAFNPLIAALTQAKEVAIRTEKNRVGQRLYELAKSSPSKNLWEVRTVKMVRYFNRSTGLVETMPASPITLFQSDNELAVKVDGKERRIIFHDPRIARAALNLGAERMNSFTRVMSFFAGIFSAVNTMLNPEFTIRNFWRDSITASINMRHFSEDDAAQVMRNVRNTWHKAFAGAYGGMKGKETTEWQKYFQEFSRSGGKVSFWQIDNPEKGIQSLNKMIEVKRSSALRNSIRLFDQHGINTRDNPILAFTERVNLAVDNAVRLAAFVELRKRGMSEADAASVSKNLTVNFNRRGEWGPVMNALFVFSNAAVQGTQILFRAMHSKKVRRIVYGMIAYGVVADLVNAWMSDEDEDEQLAYDKIPDYVHRTRLVFMFGGENPVTIPLPYGYNVFPYMGQQVGKVYRGKKTIPEAMRDTAATALQAFLPTDTVIPTVLSLPVDLATNEDWLGRPIRPEPAYGDYGPQSEKYFRSVSKASKETSEFLNWATGGNKFEPGLVDVSPEYLDHIFGFATGGMGRFIGRQGDLAAKVWNGEAVEANDVSVVRDMGYTTGVWLDRNNYYLRRDEIREAVDAAEGYRDSGQIVPPHVRRLANLSGVLKATERTLREQRKVRRANPDLDRARRDRMEDQETLAYDRLNRAYVRAMGIGGSGL